MDRSTACAKVQRTTEFTDPRIRRGDRGVQEREGEVCQKKKKKSAKSLPASEKSAAGRVGSGLPKEQSRHTVSWILVERVVSGKYKKLQV